MLNTFRFFQAANTSLDSDLSTIIVGAVHLVATFGGSMLVDKAGRKILLLISIIMMTVNLIALGVFFFIADSDPHTAESIGWLPLVSLCVYLIFFAIGYGPVPWLMLSEIYSKEYNAFASPITGAFGWTLGFVITASFGSISKAIGIGQSFWLFAALSVIGTIFTFLFVPETKGKSMNDIQRMLNGEKVGN
jgi:SP family facilitated glucose transporter-like MFS transporter 8